MSGKKLKPLRRRPKVLRKQARRSAKIETFYDEYMAANLDSVQQIQP